MSFGLTKAPANCMSLINSVFKPFVDSFVIVFIDVILIHSKSKKKEHKNHLWIILGLLEEGKNLMQCFLSMGSGKFLPTFLH